MDSDFFELLLIIVIISISLYLVGVFLFGVESGVGTTGALTSSVSAATAITAANMSIDSGGSVEGGGLVGDSEVDIDDSNKSTKEPSTNKRTTNKRTTNKRTTKETPPISSDNPPPKIPPRKDNLYVSPKDVNLSILTKSGGKTYDEYDDNDLLVELDTKYINSFENIVVDGNNFIYKLKDSLGDKGPLTPIKYTQYLEQTIDILTNIVKDRGIFIVLKDPEGTNLDDFLKFVGEKNIKSAYKKFFEEVFNKYPNVRFVVAFGKAKHRDDYAAILTSDILSDAILLSRDRYRDVSDMSSDGIKMIAYGKGSLALNKKLHKPFTYVTRGVVRNNLVGYTFSKKRKQGFYEKDVNKRSVASDVVLVIRTN
jgi:hypothetical protein